MNRAALTRAGLSLRVIPPRAGSALFPTPPDYNAVLGSIQRLRGSVYLEDGALPISAVEPDGRHLSELDEMSYHLTLWNGKVEGCLRLTPYPHSYPAENYKVFELIRRMPGVQAKIYAAAFKNCLAEWQAKGFQLGETGGLAIAGMYRMNAVSMIIPLAGWSLSRIKKRLVCIASATERNGSAEILRRLGGWRIKHEGVELPPFFDSAYGCDMEFIAFNSETLNPKFEASVTGIQELMAEQIKFHNECELNRQR
jgi:hypothetical protein